ncbi:MAG: hypothetical protein FWD52_09690, partial [Candidatus Bathyarchaeota archaeon]|nr:hypothetical protein [Candidatus Termiticorpusculum sp.]
MVAVSLDAIIPILAVLASIVTIIGVIINVYRRPKKPDSIDNQVIVVPLPFDAPQKLTTDYETPTNNGVNSVRTIHLPYQKNDYFTGRIDELAEIYENFQNKRWVYVTGMGGIG